MRLLAIAILTCSASASVIAQDPAVQVQVGNATIQTQRPEQARFEILSFVPGPYPTLKLDRVTGDVWYLAPSKARPDRWAWFPLDFEEPTRAAGPSVYQLVILKNRDVPWLFDTGNGLTWELWPSDRRRNDGTLDYLWRKLEPR
ncbi:MAG TPA: hypothetical protein VFO19_14190 [Vicinamibacterales bacterium]|nr:hypothetical protein [Vicinamibacterales bacterium]